MKIHGLMALLLAGLIASFPGRSAATSVGTIFSGPTSADPLTSYWNPGAMTLLKGHQLMLFTGASLIGVKYQRADPVTLDESKYPLASMMTPKPEVALGFVTDATLERFRFGFSFSIPVLDGVRWSEEYGGKTPSTSYYGIAAQNVHFVMRTSAAYRVHKMLSIGIGLDVIGIWLSSESLLDMGAIFNQLACSAAPSQCRVDSPLPREDPAYAGRLKVDSTGWGAGVVAGLLFEPFSWLRLGGSFASGGRRINIPLKIQASFPSAVEQYLQLNLPGVSLPPLEATAEATAFSPMIVTAGISYLPTPELDITADLHYIRKSNMSVLTVQVLQTDTPNLIADQMMVTVTRDSYVVGLRGSYALRDNLAAALRFEWISCSAPDQYTHPTSLDFYKFVFQGGVRWKPLDWLTTVVEFSQYVLVPRTIRQSVFGPKANPTTAVEAGLDKPSPVGRYSGFASKLTFGIQMVF